MNHQELIPFSFEAIQSRIAEGPNGERRLSAVDCCEAVGYAEGRKAWNTLKTRNDELAELSVVLNLRTTDGKAYQTDTLDITGVTMLCMLARTEQARSFRRWAARVLSAPSGFNVPSTYAEALRIAADEHERAEALAVKNAELEPKAQNWDLFMDSNGVLTMQRMAGLLGLGRDALFAHVRALKIFPQDKNIPYAEYQGPKRFLIKVNNRGFTYAGCAGAGFEWLTGRLRKAGYLEAQS